MEKTEILVADDDALSRTFCVDALREQGHVVRTATTGKEALSVIEAGGISLVVADLHMPEVSGLELLETVKAASSSVDVIVMTDHATFDTAVRSLKRGAADFLRKPFAAEELSAVVEAALARRRLCRENERLKGELRLHELSKSFNSVDDPIRVLRLGLEALLNASGGSAGLCLFNGTGLRFMDLLHHQGFSPEHARSVRSALMLAEAKTMRGLGGVNVLSGSRLTKAFGRTAAAEFREALLLPILQREAPAGLFVLFRGGTSGRFGVEEVAGAQFLCQQVELSCEAARRIQEARNMAFVDPLTDLHNARYLEVVLKGRIAESETLGTPFSVLFLDLDFFKEINDSHGHITGGKVLVEVSRILKENVRDEDVVIRYGGDEFTLVLPNTGREGAREAAERIRRAIREHVFLGGEGKFIHLTASIGVATYPLDARRSEELIDQADKAMYRAKEAARDVVYAAGSG